MLNNNKGTSRTISAAILLQVAAVLISEWKDPVPFPCERLPSILSFPIIVFESVVFQAQIKIRFVVWQTDFAQPKWYDEYNKIKEAIFMFEFFG